MLEISLENAGIDLLRKEAQRLNITTEGASEEQLISRIRKAQRERRTRRGLGFLRDRTTLGFLAVAVAFIAMLASWMQAGAAIGQLRASIDETNRQLNRQEIQDWQELVVYTIIDKAFSESGLKSGPSFDEIRGQFMDEAAAVEEVDLAKEDIQPTALRKVLMNLMRDSMVYQTYDGRYGVERSELLPNFGRISQQEKAGYDILHVLATETGSYDDQKLETRIIDKFQLTPKEYRYLITLLIKEGFVVRGEEGRLYCASSPPIEG